jgi:hypothetical protein
MNQKNSSFQTDESSEDTLKEEFSDIKVQPIVEEKVTDTDADTTTETDAEDKTSGYSAQRRKIRQEQRRKKTKNTTPELTLSDRERKKREEMDRSSDQLIITLNPEQSKEEHLNLMRYLREMQKQEIVIEI